MSWLGQQGSTVRVASDGAAVWACTPLTVRSIGEDGRVPLDPSATAEIRNNSYRFDGLIWAVGLGSGDPGLPRVIKIWTAGSRSKRGRSVPVEL